MPRPKIEQDLEALDLSPERALVAAMLRSAVSDARSHSKGHVQQKFKASPQAWLRDREAVLWWLSLAGLPEWVYEALLREAGMGE